MSQEIQLSAQILRVCNFVHCVTVPTCKEAKTSPHWLIISNTIDLSTVPSVELPVMQIVSYHVFYLEDNPCNIKERALVEPPL